MWRRLRLILAALLLIAGMTFPVQAATASSTGEAQATSIFGAEEGAGTSTGLGEPWDSLIKLGLMPIVVLALLAKGWLLLGREKTDWEARLAEKDLRLVERSQRIEALEAENRDIRKWMQDTAFPLVIRATDTIERLVREKG